MKNNNESIKVLEYPQVCITVMAVCAIFFTVLPFVCAVINTFGPAKADFWETVAEGIPGCIFVFSSGSLWWCWSRWRVEMYQDYFIYRNYWGIKKKYRYEDLTIDTTKAWSKTIYYLNGKKILAIAYWVEDGYALEKRVKKERRQKEKRDKANTL